MRGKAARGILTIAFDDAYLDTYVHAVKYLTRRNIKSTIAVSSSSMGKKFENRPVADINLLKEAVKAGHEIASHTIAHPNLLRLHSKDKKGFLREIVGSKKELERLLGRKINSFVFPYINRSQSKTLRHKLKPLYKSARVTQDTPSFNKIPLKDPYSIIGFAVMKNHSPDYLKRIIDYARAKNLWLIEVFHLVGKKNTLSAHRPKPYRFFMRIDDFKKHIDYVLSSGVRILPQGAAVKLLK